MSAVRCAWRRRDDPVGRDANQLVRLAQRVPSDPPFTLRRAPAKDPIRALQFDQVERKVGREEWDTTVARDIMTPAEQLAVVRPQDDAATALDKLMERDAATVPVIADGHLLGLIRRRDIMRWLQLQAPQGSAH